MYQGDFVTSPMPSGVAQRTDLDEDLQRALSRFNHQRLSPGLGEDPDATMLAAGQQALVFERWFLAAARSAVAPLTIDVPLTPDAFVGWFEELQHSGPGQNAFAVSLVGGRG